MNRTNVYASAELAGWFDYDKAERWSDEDYNHNGSGGTGRGQAVIRTAQGRWILQHWTLWQDEDSRHEYITDEAAREWLLRNDEDAAVAKYFGEIEEERGPGRPKVGEQVCFTVSPEDLALIDNMAKQGGKGRSEVLRNAVAAFVQPVKAALTEAGARR